MDQEPLRLRKARTERLTWYHFDRAVVKLADLYFDHKFTCIFGIPRGGLCMAVALSHRLKTPLLPAPLPGCLIVDDIADTGSTFNQYKSPDYTCVAWVSPETPNRWWACATIIDFHTWVTFPWEDRGLIRDETPLFSELATPRKILAEK
jgi:hypothetical protein